jgi:hypothetical protein
MTKRILSGDPPVEITLRRTARARRFSLRVSRHDGRVTLSVPLRAREDEALSFAASQEAWLRVAIGRVDPRLLVRTGATLPVAGRPLRITAAGVRSPRAEGDDLLVPDRAARVGPWVAAFLKAEARAALAESCDRHSVAIGKRYSRIRLLDTRSRWGSCAADGSLMFSWRLAMAPYAVLDYVAAHEVAHLARMDHSPAFWDIVAVLCPDFARHRTWLKTEGAALHRYLFAD